MRSKPNRRDFLKSIGLTGAALSLGVSISAQEEVPSTKRPNVILYVVDDQGSTDAGCYGNPVIRTPGLDMLAENGTRFTHAFCTSASCSASRSVILSGLYNHYNGQYGHQHAYHHFSSFDYVRSLPNLLSEAGYRTARWGKYHVAPEEIYQFQQTLPGGSPEAGASRCKSFLAAQDDRPFFLYFCTTEPHRPFRRDGDTFKPNEVIVPPYLPDSPECREELAKYYDSVERADKGLLQLLQILKQTGHWKDTVVIYLSDNGIAFPGAKTTLYEPGMRLPCVVRNPFAGKKGIVTDAMVNYADIAPTILDLCDATPKEYSFHGRSFTSVLDQEHPDGWDEIYASHTFHEITMYYPMRVVRDRRYKLIWNIAYGLEYPFASDLYASATWQGVLKRKEKFYAKRRVEAYLHRPKFELYDLQNDPDEVNNLAEDPKYETILEELKTKLRNFQKRTNDPWILKWEYE
ncbi:MAG: sulfatase-like hydrolase/transferase [Sedimentisphaerales bacterium]|nr:sulfatase-like hydrolase/transferase [Sedimentisphaerales bacterium]